MLKLTVIDQTPIHAHNTAAYAAGRSVELAIDCERWGYHRYWLAEHHHSVQFAGSAPEILITRIASATRQIRVGSGGVMLTHYSPYKVAETFALIGGLFPGRIDLGIGRAPGGGHLSSVALAAPGIAPKHDSFPQQAADLCSFLRGDFPKGHAFSTLTCGTDSSTAPTLWMLGSGGGSSTLAGQLGMGLALAKFIAPKSCSPSIFENHAKMYQQSGTPYSPPRMVALAVTCAESDDKARFIAGTAVYRKMMAGGMHREPLLSPAEVQRRYELMASHERSEFDSTLGEMVVGSPETCLRKIREIASEFACDEIGVVTVTYQFEDRLRSYELLARELSALDG